MRLNPNPMTVLIVNRADSTMRMDKPKKTKWSSWSKEINSRID